MVVGDSDRLSVQHDLGDLGSELTICEEQMNVQSFVKRPYTFVYVAEDGVEGIGFAKCNPRDKWNRHLGIEIAYGRALKDLQAKLEARAMFSITGEL